MLCSIPIMKLGDNLQTNVINLNIWRNSKSVLDLSGINTYNKVITNVNIYLPNKN